MRSSILLLTVAAGLSGSTPAPQNHSERVGFTVGSDRWLFQVNSRPDPSRTLYELHVLKNGRRLLRLPRTQPEWPMSFAVRRMPFKSSFPIVAVMSYPGAGHPHRTTFFGIRDGSLIPMGSVEAENGGPVFRDYDRDGRSEWVFDDYQWSRYYTRGPRYLKVYKQDSRGRLQLWKRGPNPTRKRLPDRVRIIGAYSGVG